MIVLLDTSEDLCKCEAEIGSEVGQLLTPLTQFKLQEGRRWAMDNGAYSGFQEANFLSLLRRERDHASECLFVALPDVVGSALRTAECFRRWRSAHAFELEGYRLALVAQDGLESIEMSPTWDEFSVLFIGGTDAFKTSRGAEQLIRAAQIMGKWVHVGRVNAPSRFDWALRMGVDSVDGSGLARFSHMREAIAKRDYQKVIEFS